MTIAQDTLLDKARHRSEPALRASDERLARDLESMTRLHELSVRLINQDDLEHVMREVMLAAAELLGAERATAQLLERREGADPTLHLVAVKGFDQEFADRFRIVTLDGFTTCAWTLGTRERVVVEDLASNPDFADLAAVAVPMGIGAVMSTPLLASDGELLGLFTTYWDAPHSPTEHQLRLLDLYVQPAARQVERHAAELALRRSEQQLQAELADTRLLQRISAAMIQHDDVEAIYDQILDAAVAITHSDCASMQMYFPEREESGGLRLLASRGFAPDAAQFWTWVKSSSLCSCGEALRSGTRSVVPDISRCEFMQGTVDQDTYLQAGIRAAQSTPLVSRSGQLIGMISTHWKRPHQPSERDLNLFDILARQAADLIERTSAEQALRRSQDELATEVADLETLRRLGLRVAETGDRTTALNDVLQTALELVGTTKGNVQLYDPSEHVLRIIAHRGFDKAFLDHFGVVPEGYSCCGAALERHERVIIEDVFADPKFRDLGTLYERHGFLAVQSTPLLTRDGRLLGMFSTHFAQPYCPSERDLRLLDQLAQQAGRIIERASAEAALREHAQTLETLNRVGAALSAELDTRKLIQAVTDAGTDLSGASFGAFFFNETQGGESYLLYTLSGAPREAFEKFGVPRNTAVFAPTFAGRGIVRSGDITKDPRYGGMAPHYGMPTGHLPVRSYLAVPVVSRTGAVLGGLFFGHSEVGVFTEQSERLVGGIAAQAAIALDNAQLYQTVRQSEERLRKVLDVERVGVLYFSLNGRMHDANSALEKMTGYTAAELREITDWSLLTPPEFGDVTTKAATELKEHGRTAPYEKQWIRKDGSRFWGLFTPTRLSGSGRETECVEFILDITDRKRAEEALREGDRRKNEFLATLAHELRNPLAPIRSGLEVLQIAKDDPVMAEEIRTTMVRQTEQLVRLIDDLMDISRITRGKLQLRRREADLHDVVESAVEATRQYMDEKGHRLSIDLPPAPVRVEVDAHRLTQVLSNLLHNAAKYSPEPGDVCLTGRVNGRDVILSVKDWGMGIPQDQLTEVFEMFAQIGRSGQDGYTGLGIGLTLTKSLVEMHGGTIEARSEGIGHGTDFIVRLPDCLRVVDARDGEQTIHHQAARAGTLRVLIVDDNKDAAHMLGLAVRVFGNSVRVVHDGFAALDTGADFRPDVVLLDLGMPRMDGCETARQLRKCDWGRDVTLVALTGWGQDDDRRRTKEAGFDHHLVKPADPVALNAIFVQRQGAIRPR